MSLSVIAGLGNPGPEYAHTRHNAGFVLVDAFARAMGAGWESDLQHEADLARVPSAKGRLLLVKPRTFMNESGRSLGALCRYYRWEPASLLLLYDDITLPLGRLKLSVRGSDGGHHGVASVLRELGDGFARLRFGIGGKGHPQMRLADHVLGRLDAEEQAVVDAALPVAVAAIRHILDLGPEQAMNFINRQS